MGLELGAGILGITKESQWQRMIEQAASEMGFTHYHTDISRGSNRGYPDLTIIGRSRAIWVECKTEKGKLTMEQVVWLEDLRNNGQLALVGRPRDWDMLAELLNPGATKLVLPEYREVVKGGYHMVLPEVQWEL